MDREDRAKGRKERIERRKKGGEKERDTKRNLEIHKKGLSYH